MKIEKLHSDWLFYEEEYIVIQSWVIGEEVYTSPEDWDSRDTTFIKDTGTFKISHEWIEIIINQ